MLLSILRSDRLRMRALRSSAFSVAGYGGSQAIRLAANLILTRLLFPETFGLMALVTVFMVGLMMVSDLGIGTAVMQSARGDDPRFLDTAWTLQALRGVFLWLGTCIIAFPVAALYREPQLALLLPVAGLSLVISGMAPIRVETAYRHLRLGRMTLIDLASQFFGLLFTIALAFWLRSVWALVIGGLAASIARYVLVLWILPGAASRPALDSQSAREIVHFGKWIFLSSLLGFLMGHGDKLILGRYLSIELLGIYNIAFFLGSFPVLLAVAVVARVLGPVYRDAGSAEAKTNVRRLRFAFTATLLLPLSILIFWGPQIAALLYDPRYALAGPILVLIACTHLPMSLGLTYDQAALAAGDSRSFFLLSAARTVVQLTLFVAGLSWGGLVGGMMALLAAHAVNHLFIIQIARRHGVWDPVHDVLFALLSLAVLAAAWREGGAAVSALAGF